MLSSRKSPMKTGLVYACVRILKGIFRTRQTGWMRNLSVWEDMGYPHRLDK
jgi:hypothetical protein